MTLCEAIAADYPQLADAMIEREAKGMATYGAPLNPRDDRRDFYREAEEELLDAAVYARAIRERGEFLYPSVEMHLMAAIEALRMSRALEGR